MNKDEYIKSQLSGDVIAIARNSMTLIIKTFNLATGEEIHRRTVGFKDHASKIWISKQIAWACNNGHGVQICNQADEFKGELANERKKAA